MWAVVALVCVLGSLIAHGFAQPPPGGLWAAQDHAMCLLPPETARTYFRSCAMKLGIRPWELGKPDDNDYDDKCFQNCVWEAQNLSNSDGDMVDDAFKAHLTKIAEANDKPSELVVELGMKCLETSRAEFAKTGGILDNKCKFAAKVSFCLRQESGKLC